MRTGRLSATGIPRSTGLQDDAAYGRYLDPSRLLMPDLEKAVRVSIFEPRLVPFGILLTASTREEDIYGGYTHEECGDRWRRALHRGSFLTIAAISSAQIASFPSRPITVTASPIRDRREIGDIDHGHVHANQAHDGSSTAFDQDKALI